MGAVHYGQWSGSTGAVGGETASKDDTGHRGGPFRWPKYSTVRLSVSAALGSTRPGVIRLRITCTRIRANSICEMIVYTAFCCLLSMIPYIYLNLRGARRYSTWCATTRCTKNRMEKEGKAALNEDSKKTDTNIRNRPSISRSRLAGSASFIRRRCRAVLVDVR